MALSTPTTKEINDNIIAQLESSIGQSIPLLPKSFLRVLAKTLAAVFTLLYKYCGFIFLQIFVKTASIKETEINGQIVSPLIEWGRLVGEGDPVAATNAQLNIQITVENQAGTLSSGAQLVGATNGVTYLTLTAVNLDAPTKNVEVLAVADQSGGGGAGVIGNLNPSEILNFANPLPNVASETVVISQTVTAADKEGTEFYRQRIIDKFQKRPQGGAYADYEDWGEEVAGIINVYPYTSDCPGQVDVYSEATEASSGSPDGIPTTAQLQAVKDSIELNGNGLASRRPAGALVNSLPITRRVFDVTVTGLDVEDTATVQQQINEAVSEYFTNSEPFIAGLSILPRLDRITNTGVGGIVDDIVSANGGVFAGVLVQTNGSGVNIYQLQEGEKAKLNDSGVVFA
tara:strand:+ start:2281 stop:3483 length:1203 start_codon:yes stop_codon:yes gene_type:complete